MTVLMLIGLTENNKYARNMYGHSQLHLPTHRLNVINRLSAISLIGYCR